MTSPHTETIEKFAWEGPLSMTQAVLLGVALAGLFAWTLWREGRVTHKWLIPLFWGLRVVMLVVVLWMLLGPTDVTVRTHSTPRSIAIFADNSGSMDVVDSPRAIEDLRWSLARQLSEANHALLLCDRANESAHAATVHFREALNLLQRGSRTDDAGRSLTASESAFSRLQGYVEKLNETNANQRLAEQSKSLQEVVQTAATELSGLAEGLTAEQVLPQAEIARLYAMLPRLEAISARVERMTLTAEQDEGLLSDTSSHVNQQSDLTLTRREKVNAVLQAAEESWLKELSETVRIRRYQLSTSTNTLSDGAWDAVSQESLTAVNETGEAPLTNLTAGLEQLTRDAAGEDLAAAVFITDGRHNFGGSRHPRDVAAGLGHLPVHVVPIGTAQMLRDVIVHHVDAPPAVAKDDLIAIDAIISTFRCEGETLDVELLKEDKVIERKQIAVETDQEDHRVAFTTKAEEFGRHAFRLRVNLLPEETNSDNNSASIEVETIEDSIRVLLADNLPRWEFRYLSNLFSRDEHLEFEQLLFAPEVSGSGRLRNFPEFPRDVDQWSRYRVVILGDVTPRQLNRESQKALQEYVTQRGGTLVVIAGQESMPHRFQSEPLEDLIPVQENSNIAGRNNGFHLQLTAEGKMADAMQMGEDQMSGDRIWREMSQSLPVYSLSEYSQPKPTSHTLIRAVSMESTENDADNGRAFLCWQTIGRGRVVYLAAPATYQLRIRNGDRYHHQFWGQLIRWAIARDLASGSKTVRIRTDKSSYRTGEEVEAIVQLQQLNGEPVTGAELVATAKQNNNLKASVPLSEDRNIPGRYSGRFDSLAAGSLMVGVTGAEIDELLASENIDGPIETPIAVNPELSAEMIDTRSDRPLLAQIAELTGGRMIPPTALSEVLQTINLSPHVTEETSQQPLWSNWICLWVVFFCLALEWTIRKMTGLS